MNNSVVSLLQSAIASEGHGTLRFNFRGVSGNEGTCGTGTTETQDLMAAAEWARSTGVENLHVAGYSFGALVALNSIRNGLAPRSLVLVSPPLDFMEFGDLKVPDVECLITAGDHDAFCSIGSLRKWLSGHAQGLKPPIVNVLGGCDHFYDGSERELSGLVRRFLQALPPS